MAGTIIAACALALGVVNLWYGVLRPWRQGRYATPDARLEELVAPPAPDQALPQQLDERVVLVNLGPAAMCDVRVELRDEDGKDMLPAYRMGPRLPIPVLHAGQAMHFSSTRAMGDNPAYVITVRWRDGRRREQVRDIYLSTLVLT